MAETLVVVSKDQEDGEGSRISYGGDYIDSLSGKVQSSSAPPSRKSRPTGRRRRSRGRHLT